MNIKYGCMYNLYILYKKDKYIYTVIKCLLFFPLQLQFWVYSIQEKSNKIGYQRKKYICESTKICQRLFWKKNLFKNI